MKINNKKINKMVLTVPSLVTAIALAPTIAVVGSKAIQNNNIKNINNSTVVNDSSLSNEDIKPLVPSVSTMYDAKLVTNDGPIVFWKESVTALDWYGAERWKIDDLKTLKNEKGDSVFPGESRNWLSSTKKVWLSWQLDNTRNVLWFLSNASNSHYNRRQWVVGLDSKTGALKYSALTRRVNGNKDTYRNISILSNGNPVIYGLGSSINNNASNVGRGNTNLMYEEFDYTKPPVDANDSSNPENTWNPRVVNKGQSAKEIEVAINSYPTSFPGSANAMDYFYNLIPVGDNVNLAFTVRKTHMSKDESTYKNDQPFEFSSQLNTNETDRNNANYSISAVLVDDDLQYVVPSDSKWGKVEAPKIIENVNNKFKNKYTIPQRDWHILLDGRIVTIAYNYLIIITPGKGTKIPTITTKAIANDDEWIESWTFDTNEDLFYKSYNETKIQKVVLDKNKQGTNHIQSLYYDLINSPIDDIKNNARNFSIYNVYGYAGQIMAINSYFDAKNGFEYNSFPDVSNGNNTNKYGLAVAITNNKNAPGQGDTKGLLNTENAFLKSADFNISNEILEKKLPSEIARGDITFLNDSFLTTNSTKDEHGNLKYEPFVKNEIDDNAKKLKLTLNLDQIPWFVTDGKMPSNSTPLKVTKEFNFNSEIDSRFSWKSVDKDDYDFKNTLPSKMTINDINRINPLVSTLTSQRVTINNVNYPNTNYKITSTDDSSGKIKIQATYSYLPLELRAIDSNVRTYISEKEYTIFKSSNERKIKFVGNDESNVANIPELKEIKESNVLPSSFLNASKQEYLKFIDTNNSSGYPLEKMNISASANDTNGTLTINIDPRAYDNSLTTATKTFTGLNTTTAYSFRFKESDSSFKKLDYLPSEINEEIFYKNFLTFSGFDSSDFELYLYPNDATGQLTANVILMGEYPNGPTVNTDFIKENGQWIARKTFNGFKTINDYNKEYQLSFKKDDNVSLSEIQKLTPSEIKTRLENENGLTIGNKTYKNVKDLIELFIESKGSKLASIDINTSSDVNVEMHINNGGGEITWSITYSNLEDYPNPITFLQTVGGFVKGNDVATKDVLTLKNSSQLKLSHSEYFEKLPSEIKAMLESDKKLISTFFLNEPTGGYKTAIEQNKFTLSVFADDNTGKLNIRISFEKEGTGIDDNSLLEYSQIYTGFNYQ